MSILPVRRSIDGEGRPRVLVRHGTPVWESQGTTDFAATTVSEAIGSAQAITSIATPSRVYCASGHGLSLLDRCRMAGTTTTPSLDGDHTVVAIVDDYYYDVSERCTSGGAGGTTRWIPDWRGVQAGMLVESQQTRSGLPDLPVYGKITAVNDTTFVLTVDEWTGGQPQDAQEYVVDGWVIDMPRSQRIRQTFEPYVLDHQLWRGRRETRFYGYRYSCVIGYDQFINADDVYALHHLLNLNENDRLVLIPHVDDQAFQYPVTLSDPLDLEPFGKAGGYRNVVLGFRGTQLVAFPSLDGYGSHYATLYGTYL